MTDILKYEEVGGDLYSIVRRLKEIDETYFVLRARKSGTLSVHSRAQKGSTHCVTLPYKTLDERAVDFVRRTRRERADELLADMKREAEKTERQRISAAMESAAARVGAAHEKEGIC